MFSYAAGNYTGYGFISDRFQLLTGTAPYDEVLHIWDLLDRAESADRVIEALQAAGIHDFAVAELADVEKVAMRLAASGNSSIQIANAVAVTGSNDVHDVVREGIFDMTMRVGDAFDSGIRLPMRRGIVRTNRLYWGEAAELSPDSHTATAHPTESLTVAELATYAQECEGDTSGKPLYASELVLAPDLGGEPAAPAPRFYLRFESGEEWPVGDITVGRNPIVPAGTVSERVILESPHVTVSSTHARIYLAQEGDEAPEVIVLDLDSTNGSRIRRGDGSVERIQRGAFAALRVGDRVDFGDGNVAQLCVR